MPSRRTVLGTVGTALGGFTAGCTGALSGEASSDDGGVRSCETSATARDEGSDLIQQADVGASDPTVFRVVLDRETPAFEPFDNLGLLSETGDAYYLPREEGTSPDDGPRRVYTQALGHFPQNGRIRVVARDEDGATLDSLTVEFTCHRTTPNPG